MIYLCLPNNPTGTVLKKDELKEWIDYAIEHKALILFDAAYEAFIEEKDIPHSVYEIEGAKKVAIEFKSYSKTAGFTGVRCAYTVVPKEAIAFTKTGKEISLNTLWKRRQCTKFNGVSYITQRGAELVKAGAYRDGADLEQQHRPQDHGDQPAERVLGEGHRQHDIYNCGQQLRRRMQPVDGRSLGCQLVHLAELVQRGFHLVHVLHP